MSSHSKNPNSFQPATSSQRQRYHDQLLCRHKKINILTWIIALLGGIYYFIWCVQVVNFSFWYIAIPYLFAEALCFGSLCLWGLMLFQRREHKPGGLSPLESFPPIDVVVTVCGEAIPIIQKTLEAVGRIDYPNYHVTVADDRADPEVKELCARLGFTHLCRPTHEHRKAGNLNYALEHTQHPFILTLDADQVPHPLIIKHLIGYFRVPTIGFVQTYQCFDVPHGDPWSNRDRVFYGAMQPGRNASNSSISCGSGVIYRRAALENIGKFSTWNMVEDLYSSLLLQAAGWRSVYHPFPLSRGSAPQDIKTHARQRWQWAVDSLRLLFWRCPLFTKGLSWRQRLNYMQFGYHYLVFGVAYPIFFLMPVWGLFSGHFLLDTTGWTFLIVRTPYFITYVIANYFLSGRRHNLASFRAQTGLFAVYFSAIATALCSRNKIPTYVVTRKKVAHTLLKVRLSHIAPHLVVIALNIGGIIVGLDTTFPFHTSLYVVNVVWALWVCFLLAPFVVLALRSR